MVVDLDVVEAWSLDGVQAGGGCREGLAGTSPEPVLVQRQHRHVAAEPPTAVRWSRADAPMGMDDVGHLGCRWLMIGEEHQRQMAEDAIAGLVLPPVRAPARRRRTLAWEVPRGVRRRGLTGAPPVPARQPAGDGRRMATPSGTPAAHTPAGPSIIWSTGWTKSCCSYQLGGVDSHKRQQ